MGIGYDSCRRGEGIIASRDSGRLWGCGMIGDIDGRGCVCLDFVDKEGEL